MEAIFESQQVSLNQRDRANKHSQKMASHLGSEYTESNPVQMFR